MPFPGMKERPWRLRHDQAGRPPTYRGGARHPARNISKGSDRFLDILSGGGADMSKTPQQGRKRGRPKSALTRPGPAQADFDEVLGLIDAARAHAVATVNTALIDLYWT